jgi:putative ABC transport system permease protein
MRSLGLLARLAGRNLRRRPSQALLLLVTLTLATATLGLALAVYGSADAPWDRVWRATNGFHVQVLAFPQPDEPADTAEVADVRRQAVELTSAPGVIAVGGPWAYLEGYLDVAGGQEELSAEVRDPGRSAVDQPLVTSGRWLTGERGVVLEDGLAEALGLQAGDAVGIEGRRFPVEGVAATVSQGRFPLSQPALVWVAPATAAELQDLGMTEDGFTLQLRLDDRADAAAFLAAHGDAVRSDTLSSVQVFTETWQERRADSHSDIDILAGVLVGVATLLAVLATATAAVLVAGRMAAEVRRVGVLKAVGVTPRQVVVVLLLEHLALAAVAVVVGLAVGRLAAPWVVGSSVTILGPPAPPMTWGRAGIVAAVAATTVLVGTVQPARRGIRDSTLRSLAVRARPPRRPRAAARLAARAGLPLPAVLGLRSAWRRPGRLVTNAAGLTLGVTTIVVALALRASLVRLDGVPVEPGEAANTKATTAFYDQVIAIIAAAAVLLVLLAAVNAIVVARFAARDNARNHAVMRALGATAGQTTAALVVSQLGASIVAVVVGIPLGVGLWSLMEGGDLPTVSLPPDQLVALAVAVPVAMAALVALPARRHARRPVSPQLTVE